MIKIHCLLRIGGNGRDVVESLYWLHGYLLKKRSFLHRDGQLYRRTRIHGIIIMMGFDTSLLDEAITRRRERWETLRQVRLAEVIRQIEVLGPLHGVQEAYIFGSLAQPGRFTNHSDIDIAVIMSSEHFFDLAAELSRALHTDVDLIPLNRCHFADKIRREGIRWTPPS
jgi:predicted nucleotidyltransferase